VGLRHLTAGGLMVGFLLAWAVYGQGQSRDWRSGLPKPPVGLVAVARLPTVTAAQPDPGALVSADERRIGQDALHSAGAVNSVAVLLDDTTSLIDHLAAPDLSSDARRDALHIALDFLRQGACAPCARLLAAEVAKEQTQAALTANGPQ
jgi:hypothetical protein